MPFLDSTIFIMGKFLKMGDRKEKKKKKRKEKAKDSQSSSSSMA